MIGRLSSRVAIVTGASTGLGRCIALRYAREGAKVVCADLTPGSNNQRTHEVIGAKGGQSLFVETDVSDERSVKDLVEKAAKTFGRLDIMVNNAAVAPEAHSPRPIYETAMNDFNTTTRVNLGGVFLGMKCAGRQMMGQESLAKGDRGWILNISSVLGLVGKSGAVAYSGAKAGVVNMTRSAALDYAPHRIHVNAISPGFTKTAMIAEQIKDASIKTQLDALHPFKGLGEPEDIANAALFLVSEECSWITGITLPVDGGYTAM